MVTTPAPSLSIVIVSWNSPEDLVACVSSLAAARGAGHAGALELVVVDNASAEFPRERLLSIWPGALVAVNAANMGFGAAANQGARMATGSAVLFLNPDTRAVDDPFAGLAEGFASHPEAVALAPRLVDESPPPAGDETQAEFQLRHLPSWPQAARELLLLDKLLPRSRALRRDRYLDRDRETPFQVEQPAAAALAVRRDDFLAVGGFDERYFPAWFEDVDLCASLAARGIILYWPSSRFLHAGRVALHRLGYDRFLPIYYRNAVRYWRKHHGRAAAGLFRALLALGMTLRLALLPFRATVPRPRREAARAYLRTLLAALFPAS